MAKRSYKRPMARCKKEHPGCMGGLISIFHFRHGRSSQRLISDWTRGSGKHAIGKNLLLTLWKSINTTSINHSLLNSSGFENVEIAQGIPFSPLCLGFNPYQAPPLHVLQDLSLVCGRGWFLVPQFPGWVPTKLKSCSISSFLTASCFLLWGLNQCTTLFVLVKNVLALTSNFFFGYLNWCILRSKCWSTVLF